MKITVIFDNYVVDSRLSVGWGFSCLIEMPGRNVLFDTGKESSILFNNMRQLQIEPDSIDAIVLSHIDDDHTGGLADFLERNSSVTVYMPRSFPQSMKDMVISSGAKLEEIHAAGELFPGAYTTGEMGKTKIEQSLILPTSEDMVLITGCAHPGIVEIVKKAQDFFPSEKIRLAMGGFHLKSTPEAEIMSIIEELKKLGVAQIAPSHCSGAEARRLFKEQYGDNYIESGGGKIISFD